MGGVLRRGSQLLVFEMDGRLSDLNISDIESALGQSVSARTGRFTNDIDLRIRTGETILSDDEIFDLENSLQTEVAMTHDVVGWRVEVT